MVAGGLSLLIPSLAATLVAKRIVPTQDTAARIVAWFLASASLIIVPIQVAAALQLLGMIPRIPLGLPAAVGAVMIVVLLAGGRGAPSLQRSAAEPVTKDPPASLRAATQAAVVVGSAYVIVAFDRLTGFPSSWDGVAYHLPLAVKWLQDGSLGILANSDWRESLPANSEIIAMLTLATGWQALAELWNVTSALAICAGAYLLGQAMGVGRPGALAGAALTASVPLVLFQAFSAYVDLFGSACLLGSLGLFCMSRHVGTTPLSTPWAVALSGLGCGLAIGTKPTLWPHAGLLALGIVASLVGSKLTSRREGVGLVLLFVAATSAPCLFWFVRSLAVSGNPFYPLAVEIPGWLALRGFRPSEITDPSFHLEFVRSRAEWLVYPWIEFKRHGYGFGTGSGFGPVFATFVPLGVPYAVWSACRLAPGPARAIRLACAAGLATSTALWWVAVQGTPRFALPMIALACVLATPYIDDALAARPRVAKALFLSAAVVSTLLSVLPTAEDLPSRARHKLWERHRFYDTPALVDELPPCSTVINYNPADEFWNNFALAGKHLANMVVPPWGAKQALDRPPDPGCASYVLDREPFMSTEEAADLGARGYRLLDLPGEARWRVWQRPGR